MSHFAPIASLLIGMVATRSGRKLEVVPPAHLTPESIYRDYARYVASIAHRLLGRDDEVDDVIQDVFLAAHRGLADLREPGAIKGWLAAITVRTARHKLRMRKLRAFFHLDSESEDEPSATDASPEDRTLVGQVYRLLDELPADERIAWTLRHLEGEKLDVVAEMCGISLATAKRRIQSAQDHLKRGLA
jgi:RNA polymerase sigma-70 factor (ECF subfamily)